MARLVYFLKRAAAHLGRSPAVAGVTVVTVAVVFLLLGLFALVGHNLSVLTDRLGEGFRLVVYLEDNCTNSEREAVRGVLQSDPNVESVSFTSREEALDEFKERLGPQAAVLDDLGKNPLPASFAATFTPEARNPESIGRLAQKVVNLVGVEEAQYGQSWLRSFFEFVSTASMLGLVLGVLILLAATVIVANTIRLSVYARREEIQILKLVGATAGFIKAPFYIEGILLGLLGAALGMLTAWILFSLMVPLVLIPQDLGRAPVRLEFLPGREVALLCLGGGLLGALGTLSSLWRHFRE